MGESYGSRYQSGSFSLFYVERGFLLPAFVISPFIYQEATATFLLLPNWMENSTNAFHKICTDNKDVCIVLGNIPKTKVRYMPLQYQQSKTPPLPEATWDWGMCILVFWNKAAREQLITNNPSYLEKQKETYHQRQSVILLLFLNRRLKGNCQDWQKQQAPQRLKRVINANIGDRSDAVQQPGSLPSCTAIALARTRGPKLERMGLHRRELYYKQRKWISV